MTSALHSADLSTSRPVARTRVKRRRSQPLALMIGIGLGVGGLGTLIEHSDPASHAAIAIVACRGAEDISTVTTNLGPQKVVRNGRVSTSTRWDRTTTCTFADGPAKVIPNGSRFAITHGAGAAAGLIVGGSISGIAARRRSRQARSNG